MYKKIIILTALPFRKYGNQSLCRFTEMLLKDGYKVTMFTSGHDPKGEDAFSDPNLIICKFRSLASSLTTSIVRVYKRLTGSKQKEYTNSREDVFFRINSWDQLPPYGAHSLKKFFLSWIAFLLLLVENMLLVAYLMLWKFSILKNTAAVVAYEVDYSYSAKVLCVIFNKPYINKFQGTVLKACGVDKKCCLMFYPKNYFGINRSDLCIMVNDGTDGDRYCEQNGLANVFFEPHGVKDYHDSDIDDQKFAGVDLNKFIIFNNASGAKWKRADRCVRFLTQLDQNVLDRLLVVTTYNGTELPSLKKLAEGLKVHNQVVFINNLNQAECNYLLKRSKIVLMTNDMSNLGNPVLEAIYYDVPVVSINDGSLDSVFKGDDGAVLLNLDLDFDKKLARTIEKMVLDNEYYLNIKRKITANKNVRSLKEQQSRELSRIQLTIKDLN